MISIEKLQARYVDLYGDEPVASNVLEYIESKLNIQLPMDFKCISKFYSGGFLGGISHHDISIEGDATNITKETLRIRESIKLDNKFIVLAEPSESFIVMNTMAKEGEAFIIWCDAVEATALNAGTFNIQPDTWGSYSEFFSYLLDEEDEER